MPVYTGFLCHAHEDKPTVEKLSQLLVEDGILTWFDKKDLLPGDDWKLKIQQAIKTYDYFLAFLSHHSCNKTGFVQKEIRLALEQRELMPEGKRYIIPIIVDDCDYSGPRKLDHQLS